MSTETLLFWIIIDPLTFILGSLGGFVIFHEFSDLDHFPSLKELSGLIRKRWIAFLSLFIAIIYFFYRMVSLVEFF
jgi:hypothetical protein